MRLVDTQTKLIELAKAIVMRYGNQDVKLWVELEKAINQAEQELC